MRGTGRKMKVISFTLPENMVAQLGKNRSEKMRKMIVYYLRIAAILKENTDALPYFIEDLDSDELYEFIKNIQSVMDELKTEGEL
jgi:protein associated with RNAse G/E